MYTHPNPTVNAALRDALFESAREITDHVTFDFNNDGQFAHEFSDLSLLIEDVELERATLSSDMPENVNTIQGFSSSELTLTLKGQRNSDELQVNFLLNPFNLTGPFFNRNLTGTDVRYSKRVETDFGPVEIRQFTGVIRSFDFTRGDGSVGIVCSDVQKWINASVTLPHWAIDTYKVPSWASGAGRPINSAWVVGEVLRQCGTPIGPLERSNAFVSFSGMGSLHHSIGKRFSEFWTAPEPKADLHRLPTTPIAPWQTGKYGPALKSVTGSGSARIQAQNKVSGSRTVFVPSNGSANPAVNIGMNAWALSNGNTTNRPHPSTVGSGTFYTDGSVMTLGLQVDTGVQNLTMNIGNNGQVFATIYVPATSAIYNFVWAFKPSGWHYYDLSFRFTSGSMNAVLTVDGVVQTPIFGGSTAVGFTYAAGQIPTANVHFPTVSIIVMDPAQHFQMYSGAAASAVYIPGQELPPVTKDGLPWVDFGGCLAEMSFLPEVWNQSAWGILQEICNAEFGGIYVSEWGQLTWKPHIALRETAMYDGVETFTVDNIIDMVVNPSLDQYKNEVNIAYTDKHQNWEKVWEPDGWQSYNIPDDNVVRTFGPYLLNGVINVSNEFRYTTGFPQKVVEGITNGWDSRYWDSGCSRFAGTYLTNLTLDMAEQSPGLPGETGYPASAWIDLSDDQRSWTLSMQVGPDSRSTGLWMGTRCIYDNSEMAVGMELWAKTYSADELGWYTLQNTSEVSEFGRYALILEQNEWRQTYATAVAIAAELLEDTINPAPVIEGLQIPCDPRLQITDTVYLIPGGGITGQIKAQIVGITRSASSSQDSIDVRIVVTPTTWVLGEAGASELGETTILGD